MNTRSPFSQVEERQSDFVRWSPRPFVVRQDEFDAGPLEVELRRVLGTLFKDDLGVDVSCARLCEHDEYIEAGFEIEGLENSVCCRLRRAELLALSAATFGARNVDLSDADGLPEALISEGWSLRFLDLVLDRFCVAASAAGGQQWVKRTASGIGNSAMPSVSAPERMLTITIVPEPCRISLEYVLSRDDAERIVLGASTEPEIARNTSTADGRLEDGLREVSVTLKAVLADRSVTLSELRDWRVGTSVALASSPSSEAELCIGGKALFQCLIARKDGFFALQLAGRSSEFSGGVK